MTANTELEMLVPRTGIQPRLRRPATVRNMNVIRYNND